MRTVLLIAAVIVFLIAALLGFDVFSTDGDPHLVGWLGVGLACFAGSFLVHD